MIATLNENQPIVDEVEPPYYLQCVDCKGTMAADSMSKHVCSYSELSGDESEIVASLGKARSLLEKQRQHRRMSTRSMVKPKRLTIDGTKFPIKSKVNLRPELTLRADRRLTAPHLRRFGIGQLVVQPGCGLAIQRNGTVNSNPGYIRGWVCGWRGQNKPEGSRFHKGYLAGVEDRNKIKSANYDPASLMAIPNLTYNTDVRSIAATHNNKRVKITIDTSGDNANIPQGVLWERAFIENQVPLKVVFCDYNQIQLDLDTKVKPNVGAIREHKIWKCFKLGVKTITTTVSKSGNHHVTITCDREVAPLERTIIACALGSDVTREWLSLDRHLHRGDPCPWVLFETTAVRPETLIPRRPARIHKKF
jgi:hypothetical protein